ncbi:MAG: transporter substrate-binding domain-containing protein [Hyphomicrobiales bacterium]
MTRLSYDTIWNCNRLFAGQLLLIFKLIFLFCAIFYGSISNAQENRVEVPKFINPNATASSVKTTTVRSIRFLTTSDFPPFNFIDPSGNLDGFNIGLAREICLEIKARCTMQALPWDDLQKALKRGQGDAIVAGLALTDSTIRELAFTKTYLRFPARFFSNAAFAETFGDFKTPKGLKIGVEKDTAHQAFLERFFPDNELLPFDSQDELRAGILKGLVQIGFADGVQTSFWLQSASAKDCCTFVGGPYINTDYFGSGLSMAVPIGRQDLKDTLNDALIRLMRKGKYSEIYLKYFPVNFF